MAKHKDVRLRKDVKQVDHDPRIRQPRQQKAYLFRRESKHTFVQFTRFLPAIFFSSIPPAITLHYYFYSEDFQQHLLFVVSQYPLSVS